MVDAPITQPAVEARDGLDPVLVERLALAMFFKEQGSKRGFIKSGGVQVQPYYRLMSRNLLLACRALGLCMTLLPQDEADV